MQKFHGGKKLLVRSTGTTIRAQAIRIRDQWAESDDGFWVAMRSGTGNATTRERYEAALNISKHLGISFDDPDNLGEAIENDKVGEFFRNDKAIKQITNPTGGIKNESQRLAAVEANLRIKTLAIGNVDKPVENVEEAKQRWLNDIIYDDWAGKSKEQKRNHRNPIDRATAFYSRIIGEDVKFLDTTREGALRLKADLDKRVREGKIGPSTANRDIGVLRRMWNDLAENDQITTLNPFDRIRWSMPKGNQSTSKKKTREPFSVDWIRTKFLNTSGLSKMNPQARAILLTLIETGARPSEIMNLRPENIYLDHNIPHFHVKAVEGREIKSSSSDRLVPLVGVALEAMRQHPEGFPRYFDKENLFSNVAMKFLRENELLESANHYVYSLRHSYVDRLRQTDAPEDLRRSIVGHFDGSVHSGYGAGFPLERKLEVMQSIELPFNPDILR